MDEKIYSIKTPTDFDQIIKDIFEIKSKQENNNLVIALEGDLGAGKTTFTQELAKYLKVSEGVNSPTFTIMKSYSLEKEDFKTLVHIDAYRIESIDEVGPLHLEGVLRQPNTIICVEWPENIKEIIPDGALKLSITILNGEERQVSLSHL